MAVALYRIDDRLIHGQVVVGWRRFLNADTIIVASDRAAGDELSRTMMEMGAPADVDVDVLTVDEAARRLHDGYYEDASAIVLFETPGDALRLVESGVAVKRLNVGGMHYREGKRLLMEAVSVDRADCESFRRLDRLGVGVYVQMVPHAKPSLLIEKLPCDI
jgi:mannose/fructose/sorbose-specific phosphotransferase system IIB component